MYSIGGNGIITSMVPEIKDFDHDENKIAAVNVVNRRDQGVFLPAVKAGRHFALWAKAENIPDGGKTYGFPSAVAEAGLRPYWHGIINHNGKRCKPL